ncbi:Gfo/Idh/MocA family oxidoreductase [Lonepinella koalarum]|uniref:Gfo/Idh/MocA family protein n=1 Tax=Lonepinella koalarum TaxID=53417 RepID=UPI0011E3EBBE|nr:Gfo/Idh/MocA family oxidoreductase [Lonepinella koalarum]TYG34734.1 Gfo/Idh/MocA family oxidoreductase [Lonepinella koalarum]
MNKIKVGIIGTGFIGVAHIEAIRRLGFVEVIAIAESNLELAEKKAKQLSIPLVYDSVDKLLANPDIQAVHNCTPNHLHAEINKKIIQSGKHVFSEKPLCLTADEADELVKLATQHQVIHGVSFVYRNFAMVQQAADMIRQQELGRIFNVHGSYLQDWLLFDTDYNWRIDHKIGGASRAVADIGSHWCDTIQFVTGKKIVAVFADLTTVHPVRKEGKNQETFTNTQNINKEYIEKPVTTEDYGMILLHFEDGSKGSFIVSQVSAGHKNDFVFNIDGNQKSLHWEQENPQYLKIGYRQKANQILCDDPSLVNASVAPNIHFPGGHIDGWHDAFTNMLQKFYRFIAENKQINKDPVDFATFTEGAYIVHIVEAILQSAKTEKWVNVT